MSEPREILILESGADELRLSLARCTGSAIEILDSIAFLSQQKREDRTALQDQNLLDDLCTAVSDRKWVGREAVCLLSGGTVSTQYFDMPALSGLALRQAVLLKLGQQLHFPATDAIVDIRTIPSTTAEKHNQIRAAVTAAHQDSARSAVDASVRMGIRLRSVTASSGAMTALAQAGSHEETDGAIFYFGERSSALVVLAGRTPVAACELPIGLEDFSKALMRPIIAGDDVIQLDARQAMDLRDAVGIPDAEQPIESLGITGAKLYPLIEPTMQKICQQLTQWLSFAATVETGMKVSCLRLTGPGAAMKGFADSLAKRLKLKVATWSWLEGVATTGDSASTMSRELFAAAAAGIRFQSNLPDLIPPDVRKQWRLRRIRRSTAFIGPIVVAGILGFTFLFNQVQSYTQTTYGAQKALNDMQSLVDVNEQWQSESRRVNELRQTLGSFEATSPAWEGLFKEMSQLLPSEMRTTRLVVSGGAYELHLRIDADVFTTPTGRDFDEVIEQTLRSFERSPFFQKVQLINSVRYPPDGTRVETGMMSVDLRLAYQCPTNPKEAAPQ